MLTCTRIYHPNTFRSKQFAKQAFLRAVFEDNSLEDDANFPKEAIKLSLDSHLKWRRYRLAFSEVTKPCIESSHFDLNHFSDISATFSPISNSNKPYISPRNQEKVILL